MIVCVIFWIHWGKHIHSFNVSGILLSRRSRCSLHFTCRKGECPANARMGGCGPVNWLVHYIKHIIRRKNLFTVSILTAWLFSQSGQCLFTNNKKLIELTILTIIPAYSSLSTYRSCNQTNSSCSLTTEKSLSLKSGRVVCCEMSEEVCFDNNRYKLYEHKIKLTTKVWICHISWHGTTNLSMNGKLDSVSLT